MTINSIKNETKQMSQQIKLLFSLLTALAVCPLIGRSDSPSSSSSSSLTANMTDAAESGRTKRKPFGAYNGKIEAEEHDSIHAKKSLRSSVFSTGDNSSRPEKASTAVLIIDKENSPPSILHGLNAPIPIPVNKVVSIPAWYYASPLFKLTFEHLNYADLTEARSVSKAFHALAPQVLMPTGQHWVTQFIKRFARAKTATEKFNAYRDVVSAVGRCPNPIVKIEEIVHDYYRRVPNELQFWDGEGDKIPNLAKDILRNELGAVLNEIKKVKAKKQRTCAALKQQAHQADAARELDELNARYGKILGPLKTKQAQIVDALMPSLRALCPYATASMILHGLTGKQILPEMLPLVHEKDEGLDARGLQVMAKKFATKELVSVLTASCVPSVHESLVTQKDRSGRESRAALEHHFIQPTATEKLNPARLPHLIIDDQLDIQMRLIRLEQLNQARNDIILHKRFFPIRLIETAYWQQKNSTHQFLITRINSYIKGLELPEKQPNDIVTAHILRLIRTLIITLDPHELADCKLISRVCEGWHTFLDSRNPLDRNEILQEIAYLADRALDIGNGSEYAYDLAAAEFAHIKLNNNEKADQYYDQLFTEYKCEEILDYLNASIVSVKLAAHYKNNQPEKAKRHGSTALKRLNRAMELMPLVSHRLSSPVQYFKKCADIMDQLSEFLTTHQVGALVVKKVHTCHEVIKTKIQQFGFISSTVEGVIH